jgi:hypothetical protein
MIETVIDTDIEKRDATRGRWLAGLRRRTGLDRAIAYTVMARVFQIVGSTGTVLLIVRFLTPVEQGPADDFRTGLLLRDPATGRA